MGVAANGPHLLPDIAPRTPLLEFLEITPGFSLFKTPSGGHNESIGGPDPVRWPYVLHPCPTVEPESLYKIIPCYILKSSSK